MNVVLEELSRYNQKESIEWINYYWNLNKLVERMEK